MKVLRQFIKENLQAICLEFQHRDNTGVWPVPHPMRDALLDRLRLADPEAAFITVEGMVAKEAIERGAAPRSITEISDELYAELKTRGWKKTEIGWEHKSMRHVHRNLGSVLEELRKEEAGTKPKKKKG